MSFSYSRSNIYSDPEFVNFISKSIFDVTEDFIESINDECIAKSWKLPNISSLHISYIRNCLAKVMPLTISACYTNLISFNLHLSTCHFIDNDQSTFNELFTPESFDALYALLRDSDDFNKFLYLSLNSQDNPILPCLNSKEVLQSWSQNDGFENKDKISTILWYELNMLNRVELFASKTYHKLRRYLAINTSLLFAKSSLKRKYLSSISHIPHISNLFTRHLGLPLILNKRNVDVNIPVQTRPEKNNKLREYLSSELYQALSLRLRNSNDKLLSTDQVRSIAHHAIQLVPTNLLENATIFYEKLLTDRKIKSLILNNTAAFTYAVSGSDKYILITSLLKTFNFKIVSFQHSACGGYLKNSSVISLFNIFKSDEYVTYSSARHPDPFFKNHRISNIPSIQYHHFNQTWRNKQFVDVASSIARLPNKQKVLIVMGEKYPYSPLYQGLYPNSETTSDFVSSISCLAQGLIKLGFDVYVKPYNNLICLRHTREFSDMSRMGVNVLRPSLYRVGYILNRFDFFVFDMISSALFEASISSKSFRLFINSSFSYSYNLSTPQVNLDNSALIYDDIDKLVDSIHVERSQPATFSDEYFAWKSFVAYHTGYDQSFRSIKSQWSKLLSRFVV